MKALSELYLRAIGLLIAFMVTLVMMAQFFYVLPYLAAVIVLAVIGRIVWYVTSTRSDL